MINANSELDFIFRAFRSYMGFKARVFFAWVRYGHVFRKRKIKSYLSSGRSLLLHLGASHCVEGFLNSQILGEVPIDITKKLPFPDGSLDMIYSSHLVEHIHRKEFYRFLLDSSRVLKEGGIHIIATPSITKIIDAVYHEKGPAEVIDQLLQRGRSYYEDDIYTACHHLNLSMRAWGHRFLMDSEFIKSAALRYGYSCLEVIENVDVPNQQLSDYLKSKPARWDLQTQTYVLHK